VFGGHDDLTQRENGVAYPLESEFHRVDLRYDHAIGTTGTLRVASTFGLDDANDGTGAAHDLLLGLRVDVDDRLAQAVRLRAGVDATFEHLWPDQAPSGLATEALMLYPRRNDATIGAYADIVWRVTDRVEIVPGVRADLFTVHRLDDATYLPLIPVSQRITDDGAMVGVDPRLAARVTLSQRVLFLSTFGVSHQLPGFFIPTPGLIFAEPQPTLETAIQTSQGVQVALPLEITGTATVYLQDFRHLADLAATCHGLANVFTDASTISALARNPCIDETVPGRAFGAEISLRRSLTKRITGWISYTLSRSTREVELPGSTETVTALSEFDRTHVVSVIGAYDFGRGWRAGARFYAYSGMPYAAFVPGVAEPPYDTERLPAFYRLDVRLEKRWRIRARSSVAVIAEGLNVTANKEATSAECSFGKCSPVYTGPLTLPSLGIELVL
jgi:hypothetical protein